MGNEKKVIYLYLQNRLLEKSGKDCIINIKDVYYHIFNLKMPKCIYPVILKELEEMNLIKRIDRFNIQVINKEKCREVDKLNVLYKNNGIF